MRTIYYSSISFLHFSIGPTRESIPAHIFPLYSLIHYPFYSYSNTHIPATHKSRWEQSANQIFGCCPYFHISLSSYHCTCNSHTSSFLSSPASAHFPYLLSPTLHTLLYLFLQNPSLKRQTKLRTLRERERERERETESESSYPLFLRPFLRS